MGKATYFISDLHLGASHMAGDRSYELRAVAFLDSIKNDAGRLYLVGDILDYWYEYRYVVPKGFVRFFGKLAELADAGVKITWLLGNHDVWLYSYFQEELGIEVRDNATIEEINGARFYIAHGDGVGAIRPSMRFIRALFRNRIAQFFYSAVHPRWTVPLAKGLSFGSRKSKLSKYDAETAKTRLTAHLNNLVEYADNFNASRPDPIDYFIFGHLHIVSDQQLANGGRLIVLGDWIKLFSYAKFVDNELSINYFNSF